MMRPAVSALLLGLAALLLIPAAAAANPFYLTGKLGSTDTRVDVGSDLSAVLDGDDDSSSFGLGLKLGRYLAFQAERHDLGSVSGFGSPCPPSDQLCIAQAVPLAADLDAISLTVLPHLPLGRRAWVYAKLGVVSFDADVTAIGELADDFKRKVEEEEVLYGAGVRFKLLVGLGVYAEIERLADEVETVGVGATWGF